MRMIRLKMTELKFYTHAFAMIKSFKISNCTVEPDSYGGLIVYLSIRAKVEPALLTLALSKHLVNVFVEINEIKRCVQYFVQY